MATYLINWETVPARWPTDVKERNALRTKMLKIVQQDIKEGKTKSWGQFVGGGKGYNVQDGRDGVEIARDLQRFVPYFTFSVQQVLTLDEVEKVFEP